MKKTTKPSPLPSGGGAGGGVKAGQGRDAEHRLQAACVRWFAYQHRLLDGLLFAIPNGGHRLPAVAGKLRAEGVRAGVADLFLSVARHGCHGLYIETKTPVGRQATAQRTFQQRVTAEGYAYIIIRGLDEFRQAVNAYLTDTQ